MYGPLANILLSCYGVGMEQTYTAKVDSIWSPGTDTSGREVVEVEFSDPEDELSLDFTLYIFRSDCPWQVGDEVEIVLRKKTKETTHD